MNQANKQAKVALVTGGARRIGAAIVNKLHEAGFRVVIHCRNSLDEAQELAVLLNAKRANSAFVLQKELMDSDSAEFIKKYVMDVCGRLDLLVNNASIFIRSDCTSLTSKNWESQFHINVKVPFLLSIAFRPLLAAHHGVIVNITDIHGQEPLKGYAAYSQTKAALEMQTRALAREFAPDVRVNGVAPGAIAWPEDSNSLSAEQQQSIINNTPLKSHGSPEFIAQAVLSLVENPFITGQILNVDGGRSCA